MYVMNKTGILCKNKDAIDNNYMYASCIAEE